jgi:hypothetical protein
MTMRPSPERPDLGASWAALPTGSKVILILLCALVGACVAPLAVWLVRVGGGEAVEAFRTVWRWALGS